MKKAVLLLAVLALGFSAVSAQKYITKEGTIDIFSETSLFTIEAKNQKVGSVLNAETGDVIATTLVRSFKFKEALVEEHFNENYMQSEKFPKSQFKGKITNFSSVNIKKDGTYPITIEGDLTMHGETRKEILKGSLVVKGTKLLATAETKVSLENYKITVEESYKDRINDDILLEIRFDYNAL